MTEPVLFQDELVTLTAEQVVTGEACCPIAEIVETRLRGGTGIEEKIFLSLIAFFALGVAVVGLALSDRGELVLGLGLAAVGAFFLLRKSRAA